MHPLKLILFLTIVCLTGCTPKITNDKSTGEAETNAYNALSGQITEQLKMKFNGNMYQNEKITPQDFADGIKIGIPGVVIYTFRKDNSKFVKGDLNNDKKTDLVIWADLTEQHGYETKIIGCEDYKDDSKDRYIAYIKGNILDYTIHDSTGEILKNPDKTIEKFSDTYHFVRGKKNWILEDIDNSVSLLDIVTARNYKE